MTLKKLKSRIDWKAVIQMYMIFGVLMATLAFFYHDIGVFTTSMCVFTCLVIVLILHVAFEKPKAPTSAKVNCSCDLCGDKLYISIDGPDDESLVAVNIWDWRHEKSRNLFLYLDKEGVHQLIKALKEAEPQYYRLKK